MKKIVAIVLSLVMVLGLATTAFGAALPQEFDVYSTDTDAVTWQDATLEPVAAVAAKDTDKDGIINTPGNVAYFNFAVAGADTGLDLIQVATVAEADYIFKYEGKDTVFGYFVAGNPSYKGTGAVFTNFGEECGQYDDEPAAGATYYTFEGKLYVGAVAGTENLMVGGKLVAVNDIDVAANWVVHAPEFTYDATYKVVAVKCAECGVVANIYDNFSAVPKADKLALNYFNINTDDYYCWTAAKAPAADATDKVESAQTFDAGIAMYVGMSVMAAAGSAVVLKKKD